MIIVKCHNNFESALRKLKKKCIQEDRFRKLSLQRSYKKPSMASRFKSAEAAKRRSKDYKRAFAAKNKWCS